MERTIEVTYYWDLDEFPKLDDETKEQLCEHAENRILNMKKEGYSSGELLHEDSEGNSYRGWWEWTVKNA